MADVQVKIGIDALTPEDMAKHSKTIAAAVKKQLAQPLPPLPVRAPKPSEVAASNLDTWFVAHIHGTALSRNHRAYNEAHAAYQRLRGFLSHLDD